MNSLAELKAAAKADGIRPIKGLGASLQTKNLHNLAIARSGEAQLHLHKAAALLEHAVISVKQEHPEFARVKIAGDFRRGCELVADLALVALGKRRTEIEQSTLRLVVTDNKHFGASLLEATGSAAHLEQLKMYAAQRGFALKSDGLYRGRKLIASATEVEIYEALDLQFIEPELREGRDEIERAASQQLPPLVREKISMGSCILTRPHPRDAGYSWGRREVPRPGAHIALFFWHQIGRYETNDRS